MYFILRARHVGYLVENGLNRQAFGGRNITDTLNSYLTEYRLFTPVEHLITRMVKEKVNAKSPGHLCGSRTVMLQEAEYDIIARWP